MLSGRDYYDAFVEYQGRLLAQFEVMVDEYDFCRINATRSIREVFQDLKDSIQELLVDMKPVSAARAERELEAARAEVA